MSESDREIRNLVGFTLDMVDGLWSSGRSGETFMIPAEVFWGVFMRMDAPVDVEKVPGVIADIGSSIAEDMAATFRSPSILLVNRMDHYDDACTSEERFLECVSKSIMMSLCRRGWLIYHARSTVNGEESLG